jgi:Fic family protein
MEPFIPDKLPLTELDWAKFVPYIARANYELAHYDGILQGMVNPVILLSPLTTREAVLSSKIEGTQATVQEVLEFEAVSAKQGVEGTNKVEDIREVINYRKAVDNAIEYLKKRPISLNLLKRIHLVLLDSVRGKDKQRGEFRTDQNYIGKPDSDITHASYIPPRPELLPELLDNLEKYIHFEEKDRLVQLSIVHAQFEIIHPFLDGNGRVGRILVPLFLLKKGLLSLPVFYISDFLDAHRDNYYERLNRITAAGDWDSWILFFLEAIIAQAKNNASKAKAVLKLYNETKDKITLCTHSQFAIQTLDTIFKYPAFNAPIFVEYSKMSLPSANRILRALVQNNIIKEVLKGSGRRPSLFAFNDLLDLIK